MEELKEKASERISLLESRRAETRPAQSAQDSEKRIELLQLQLQQQEQQMQQMLQLQDQQRRQQPPLPQQQQPPPQQQQQLQQMPQAQATEEAKAEREKGEQVAEKLRAQLDDARSANMNSQVQAARLQGAEP